MTIANWRRGVEEFATYMYICVYICILARTHTTPENHTVSQQVKLPIVKQLLSAETRPSGHFAHGRGNRGLTTTPCEPRLLR
jgi:hypothetical protein